MRGDITDFMCDRSMRDIDMRAAVLVMLLADQIKTLGKFFKKGLWLENPDELGEWLRRDSERVGLGKGNFSHHREEVMMEWKLWGHGTDVLIDVLEQQTSIRIDRPRIVKLAKRSGTRDEVEIARRNRNQQRAYELRRKRAGYVRKKPIKAAQSDRTLKAANPETLNPSM